MMPFEQNHKSLLITQEPTNFQQGFQEISPSAMFSVDREYQYTAFNHTHSQSMLAFYGATIELGGCLLDYITIAEDRQDIKNKLDQALGGEQITNVTRTGKDKPWWAFYHSVLAPMRSIAGDVVGVTVLVLDITGLKQQLLKLAVQVPEMNLQQILDIQSFSQNILDASPIGTLIYNAAGNCISANKAAGTILGIEHKTLLNQNFQLLEFSKAPGMPAAAMQALYSGHQVSLLVSATSMLGRKIWLNVTVTSFKMAGETNLLLMFEDASRRIESDMNLITTNEKLTLMIEDLERSKKNSELLRKIISMLQICANAHEAYQVIEQYALQLIPSTSGAIFMKKQDSRIVEVASVWGKNLGSEQVFAQDNCWALRSGQVNRVNTSPAGLKCQHMNSDFTGCYLDIPLVAAGETIGLLHLEWFQVVEIEETIGELACVFADHISLALSNISLRETLHHQTVRDPLTNAFNRRYMEETLNRELARANRRQGHVGLILMDIDFFKHFNDTYGHAIGDLALTRLVTLLHTLFRSEDIICRMGGEEFLIILPDTSLSVTCERAETIRKAVQAMRMEHNKQVLGEITISLGIAMYPENGLAGEEILLKADRALYQAKANGRNRVEVAEEPNSY
jgi:diguanylate cyclase (GGDEF)-like protein/PAS domain S-box-containing protein